MSNHWNRREYANGVAPEDRPPRASWTINGRFLTQNVTGVQRYGREIVRALDALVSEQHPLTEGLNLELLVPEASEPIDLAAIPVRRTGRLVGHAWEQWTLAREARGGILSLCNTSTPLRSKQVVCIHDATMIDCPASFSRAFRLLYRTLLPVLGRRAALVTTVSEYSRTRLAKHRIAAPGKVRVVPNGHEHALGWRIDPSASALPVDRNTILVIGSPAPHKNVGLLLRMANDLAVHGIKVAVVGSLDRKVFAGAGLESDGPVNWLGRLSDGEMAAALARCLCLAFPSLAEGFGLPPLEAMARGCPVVVSNRASVPEVCGDGALYAAPDDPQSWLTAFLALRGNPALRERLVEKGFGRASRYSWYRSAEMYLEAMAGVDAAARAPRFGSEMRTRVSGAGPIVSPQERRVLPLEPSRASRRASLRPWDG